MRYSIGEFAKKIGVNIQTLRNWDKQGKLKPAYIGKNGCRYYSESQVEEAIQKKNSRKGTKVEWEKKYQDLKTEYDILKARLSIVEKKYLNEEKECEKEIEKYKTETEKLNKTIEELQKVISDKEKEVARLKLEIENIKEDTSVQKNDTNCIEEIEKIKQEHKEKIRDWMEYRKEAEQRISELFKEVSKYKNELNKILEIFENYLSADNEKETVLLLIKFIRETKIQEK